MVILAQLSLRKQATSAREDINLEYLSVGRKSINGGVLPAGPNRIQFNFVIDGVRFRPTLPWAPNRINLERAGRLLMRIKAQIEAGTSYFSEIFPDYRMLKRIPAGVISDAWPPRLFTHCGEPSST